MLDPAPTFKVRGALLKPFGTDLVRLTADGVGEYPNGRFGDHLILAASAQSRSHRPLQRAEEAFHRPSLPKACFFEISGAHLSAPLATPPAVCPPLHRLDDTFHTPLLPTLLMNPLRIIARVSIDPPRFSHFL